MCGILGGYKVAGNGYEFAVDPEMDSWLCPDGQLMPVASAVLEDCDEGPIQWTSLVILGNGTVQVNYKVPKEDGYHIDFYPLEALSFVGDTYSDIE
jgi:hypothetical protein